MMHTLTFSRSFNTRVEPTENVKDCAAMFGIGVDETIEVVLYQDLTVRLGAGRVLYITGESGAGKSCLLRDIMARVEEHPRFRLIPGFDVAKLPELPLVDQFGDWSIKRVGEILNFVGIAEAFIYLRKPRELSDGQRYRFMLARMIYDAVCAAESNDDRIPVIGIDEFLAFLDRETARNVAYQVRRVTSKYNLCVVVATTHEDISSDLQANQTVTMRLNVPPQIKNTPLAGK